MEEMSKHGRIGRAAMKAGMDRKTARKYVAGGKLPSEMATTREWRTRLDPFDEHWTTNLAFKQWGAVFPGAACVVALVDRFNQHCHRLTIDADSWRETHGLDDTDPPPARPPSRRRRTRAPAAT